MDLGTTVIRAEGKPKVRYDLPWINSFGGELVMGHIFIYVFDGEWQGALGRQNLWLLFCVFAYVLYFVLSLQIL